MNAAVPLMQPPEFSDIDRHFAAFLAKFGGDPVFLPCAAAALSKSVREGHVCLNLAGIAAGFAGSEAAGGILWPSASEWRRELERSAAVGAPEAQRPLVLDGAGRLYLRRYWNYQDRLARAIREKCSRNSPARAVGGATQEEAVEAALRNELTIICGGPGTGKTSTVVRVLARLMEASGGERLRIALTAPTGKAASRLEEAVREGAGQLPDAEPIRQLVQKGAKTIHRLLEPKGRSTSFRYNRESPLPLDILIVDEASMVALPLMAKLFDAVSAECRILLLGDRDQLASVEPGTVLADMVDAAALPNSPLQGSLITLRKNYRFHDESDIQQACSLVRAGDAARTVTLLRTGTQGDLISTETSALRHMREHVAARVTAGFAHAISAKNPGAALQALKQFRVLTPLRQGPWGVVGLTEVIERALFAAKLITADGNAPYAGKPILILQNDYNLGLYNGDLGVLLPDPDLPSEPGELYGWFSGKENDVRRFAHVRLPSHETAYAMTVHKSQGSEFGQVLFVLPDVDSPLLTRELIYTALTRARSRVDFVWNEPVIRAAVARRRDRASGLRDLLVGTLRGNPE